MRCPGCRASLREAPETCPVCGYGAETALRNFIFEAERLQRFVDPQGRIHAKTRREANRSIDRLRREFPQVHPYIFIARLPPGIDVREFGFWLFNRSAPANRKEEAERLYGVLFIFDRTSGSASITIGYGLDPFLSDSDLRIILENSREAFLGGQYGIGIANGIEALCVLLREKHAEAHEAVKEWKRRGSPRPRPAAPATVSTSVIHATADRTDPAPVEVEQQDDAELSTVASEDRW